MYNMEKPRALFFARKIAIAIITTATAVTTLTPAVDASGISSSQNIVMASIGDTNGDGEVNITDAAEILSCYAELSAGIVDTLPQVMDVNGDGEVNLADAVAVLQYYAARSAGLNPVWPPFQEDVTTTTTTSVIPEETTTSTTVTTTTSAEFISGDLLMFTGSDSIREWTLRKDEEGNPSNEYISISRGETVLVLQQSMVWYLVMYNGQKYYSELDPKYFSVIERCSTTVATTTASKPTVTTIETTTAAIQESSTTTTKTTTTPKVTTSTTTSSAYNVGDQVKFVGNESNKNWNVRSSMSTSSANIEGTLSVGDVVEILVAKDGNWYLIKCGSLYGYIKIQVPNTVFELIEPETTTTVATSTTSVKTTTTSKPTTTSTKSTSTSKSTTNTTTSTSTKLTTTKTSTTEPTEIYYPGMLLEIVYEKGWNIRSERDLTSDVMVRMAYGDRFEIITVLDNYWYYVLYNNQNNNQTYGYVRIIPDHRVSFDIIAMYVNEVVESYDALRPGDLIALVNGAGWYYYNTIEAELYGGTIYASNGDTFVIEEIYVDNYRGWIKVKLIQQKKEVFLKWDSIESPKFWRRRN